MYEYKYLNKGASFSTPEAARAFVAAISVCPYVKDVESEYKRNKFGIVSVWFMMEADADANKGAELSALVPAIENMFN